MTFFSGLVSRERSGWRSGARLLVLLFVAVPLVAQAATVIESRLINAACRIANYLFTISLVVGIGAALWAAFQYMTAGGDSNKVSGAHKTLTYAAIGIAVALLAGSVPGLVASLLDPTLTVTIPAACQ